MVIYLRDEPPPSRSLSSLRLPESAGENMQGHEPVLRAINNHHHRSRWLPAGFTSGIQEHGRRICCRIGQSRTSNGQRAASLAPAHLGRHRELAALAVRLQRCDLSGLASQTSSRSCLSRSACLHPTGMQQNKLPCRLCHPTHATVGMTEKTYA